MNLRSFHAFAFHVVCVAGENVLTHTLAKPESAATPLPSQCNNRAVELSPVRYIANGTKYTNCTLKGQAGTVIQGFIGQPSAISERMQYVHLSGTMILEEVSTENLIIVFAGDNITVRKSNITAGSYNVHGGVIGGQVYFEDTNLKEFQGVENANVEFRRTKVTNEYSSFNVWDSQANFYDSSVSIERESYGIGFTRSDAAIYSSEFLILGHGQFAMIDSGSSFIPDSSRPNRVYIGYGGQSTPMLFQNSTTLVLCALSPNDKGLTKTGIPVFQIADSGSFADVSIIGGSRITFEYCPCDMSRAFFEHASASINIEMSTVQSYQCINEVASTKGNHLAESFIV